MGRRLCVMVSGSPFHLCGSDRRRCRVVNSPPPPAEKAWSTTNRLQIWGEECDASEGCPCRACSHGSCLRRAAPRLRQWSRTSGRRSARFLGGLWVVEMCRPRICLPGVGCAGRFVSGARYDPVFDGGGIRADAGGHLSGRSQRGNVEFLQGSWSDPRHYPGDLHGAGGRGGGDGDPGREHRRFEPSGDGGPLRSGRVPCHENRRVPFAPSASRHALCGALGFFRRRPGLPGPSDFRTPSQEPTDGFSAVDYLPLPPGGRAATHRGGGGRSLVCRGRWSRGPRERACAGWARADQTRARPDSTTSRPSRSWSSVAMRGIRNLSTLPCVPQGRVITPFS